MGLEQLLNELKGLHGYLGSAILDGDGAVVVSDSVDDSVDFGAALRTLSGILDGMHEAAVVMGFAKAHEIAVQTGKGLLLLHCGGGSGSGHMHAVCLLRPDGNLALAKMALYKIVPRLKA